MSILTWVHVDADIMFSLCCGIMYLQDEIYLYKCMYVRVQTCVNVQGRYMAQ